MHNHNNVVFRRAYSKTTPRAYICSTSNFLSSFCILFFSSSMLWQQTLEFRGKVVRWRYLFIFPHFPMRVYVCYCSCHMEKGWLGISLTRKCFAYRNWIVTSHGVNFLPPQPFSFSRQFAFSNTYLCIYLFICDLEYILYIIIIIVALSRLIRHFVLQAQFSLLFSERTTIILRGNCVF